MDAQKLPASLSFQKMNSFQMIGQSKWLQGEVGPLGVRYINDDLIVGVEGGGTSFVVSIARRIDPISVTRNGDQSQQEQEQQQQQFGVPIDVERVVMGMEILLEVEFPTSDEPQETLVQVSEFLQSHIPPCGSYSSLGFACFGPVGLNRARADYGTILPTSPKANWRGVNVLEPILKACGNGCYHKFDTDVNAPAMAEFLQPQQQQQGQFSASPKISSLAYVTVGTGVGVGLIINGKPVHGMMHPEGGHIHVQPLEGDTFHQGYSWGEKCPYRGKHTVEGIASSVALVERLEAMQQEDDAIHLVKPSSSPSSTSSCANHSEALGSNKRASILKDLEDTHPIWSHAAFALANLCVSLILLNSIEKIVLGGGIVRRGEMLLQKVRQDTLMLLNGYIDTEELRNISEYITVSHFGNKAGLVGSLVLGKIALEDGRKADIGGRSSIINTVHTEDTPQQQSSKPDADKDSAFWKGFMVGFSNGFIKGYVTAIAMIFVGHVLLDFASRNKGEKRYSTRIYR